VSAEIFRLSDYRPADSVDLEVDLVTAVDAAVRDLGEILACWGSELARRRTEECELFFSGAYSRYIGVGSDSGV
jgi:hypothetical protein